jgi:hypothetical protein
MSLPGLVCAGEPATCDDVLNHDRRELSVSLIARRPCDTVQAGRNCMILAIQKEKDSPDTFDP